MPQPYTFRIAVTPQRHGRDHRHHTIHRWVVKAYWSDSMVGYMGVFRWRWQALRAAHKFAQDRVAQQGDNLRLEVTTPDRVQKVYGRDPRSIT